MIDRVHFENFKSLANVTLDLGRFTALVGANGCGKSSVLQAMDLSWSGALWDQGQLAAMRLHRAIYRSQPGVVAFSAHADGGDEYKIEIQVTADRPVHPRYSRSASHPEQFFATHLQLDSAVMRQTSVPTDEHPVMAVDGSGLASALAWMKGAAEDDLAKITSDLRRVVPGVKRVRTLRERITGRRIEKIDIDGQPVWRPVDGSQLGDRFEIEFDDGSQVPSDLLSEGTVLALGVLTKLHEPNRPHILLIDDIERGLHLTAQVSLIQALRDLMKLDPELQIICTTHSPYLLDLFEAAEVRVLALDSERRTHARPLTEHPDFGKWKFGTQTGELWAALGEDRVVAGATG